MGLFKVKSKRSGEKRTVYHVRRSSVEGDTEFLIYHFGRWDLDDAKNYEPLEE